MVRRFSVASRIFDLINCCILIILALSCVLPILNLLAISLSQSAATTANLVKFWPIGFNVASYQEVFRSSGFMRAFSISIMRVAIGTAISLFMIVTASYPLSMSHKEFKGRNIIMLFYMFSMMFSGGLIPFFITVTKVGLYNNFWVLIIPGCVPVFSIIVMMNFFRGLPKQIYEAARIDGCGHFTTLLRIFLPLSTASLATVTLFSVVGHWNDWFTGMIFLDKEKFPLQTYLRQLLVKVDMSRLTMDQIERIKLISDRSFRAAQLFLAIVPILCIYPFLQKYFVTGLTLGSVKE